MAIDFLESSTTTLNSSTQKKWLWTTLKSAREARQQILPRTTKDISKNYFKEFVGMAAALNLGYKRSPQGSKL